MSRLDFCKYQLVDDCYDWKTNNCDECNIFKAYCEGARRAKNSIVRCKDCIHNLGETTGGESVVCNYCTHGMLTERNNEWYCADGERKKP